MRERYLDLSANDGPFGGKMQWDMNKGRFFDSKRPQGPFYYPWNGGPPFEGWRKRIMDERERLKKLYGI